MENGEEQHFDYAQCTPKRNIHNYSHKKKKSVGINGMNFKFEQFLLTGWVAVDEDCTNVGSGIVVL